MRVEVIGAMGVGKTTLCRALEKSGLTCVYEEPENNPYMKLSYKNPKKYGFYSQISFILSNYYTTGRYKTGDNISFLDFSTITDKAYASLFLRGRERRLALEMIEHLERKEGYADLYLHVVCSPRQQLERVRERKRDYEKRIGPKFIDKLNGYIDHYVQVAEMNGANILTVDTDNVDYGREPDFITSLTKTIRHKLQTPYTWTKRPAANTDNQLIAQRKA